MIKYFSQYPLRIVFLIFTLASMVAIFMFSAEDANVSSDTSGGFTQTAIELFVQDYDELPVEKQQEIWDKADHIIRKTAHFTIAAMYTMIVARMMMSDVFIISSFKVF